MLYLALVTLRIFSFFCHKDVSIVVFMGSILGDLHRFGGSVHSTTILYDEIDDVCSNSLFLNF